MTAKNPASLFATNPPSTLARKAFVNLYGGVYEHSPWIAERLYDEGIPDILDTPETLAAAMALIVDRAVKPEQLALLRAHPDLAGKLKLADLTASSRAEQTGAQLDQCTPDELASFTELNDLYKAKFGFPFIFAVKGYHRRDILAAFEKRVKNDPDTEFAQALAQVHRIALLRLQGL
ncbi:2-oxo-4-hydroxy-4-carboxy-5-ureidoimidazoline decarboxylase [Thalassospira sp.]|uniref:2-oxo-4-hydroxy-4-carboxy-5-ureidoimidazoline decarboxylase n=1 Tax=Thalassospira sp. TaxID=1912094 RepID=UPI002736AB72|nr:2-oxo-4-hydroxy-4-carboxy-5-ureidoimidazoline decarboxylase [Thalassospira sp.]MDP2698948.1 2-oxo-4-hydroxy-4-carboxy-5-ureidoimidazoline decarboxylase [Thalassospira sp.]